MDRIGASQSALFNSVTDSGATVPVLLNQHTDEGMWELYKSYYGKIDPFAGLYGITSSEIRVMEQLLIQQNTQEIADALQVSIKTVRAHLSQLFTKTATTCQRELVRFYLAHPGPSRDDEKANNG